MKIFYKHVLKVSMFVFSPIPNVTEFIYKYSRLIHTLKLGSALLVAVIINEVWPLPHSLWALVTIVIIMMHLPQVGRTVDKSFQRAIGTILGSGYGFLLIFCFTDDRIIMLAMILAVMSLGYLAIGRFSYAYLVAGFTMIIVIGDGTHDTAEAAWRTLNILLGCFIAMGVSLFVFPIKAKEDWRHQLYFSLDLTIKILANQLALNKVDEEDCAIELAKINRCIVSQRNLFFSLTWESVTLGRHQKLLIKLANQQNRMVTLLALLTQTHLDQNTAIQYKHIAPKINQVSMGLIRQLYELSKYVKGDISELTLDPNELLLKIKSLMRDLTKGSNTMDSDSYGYCWSIYQVANITMNMHQIISQITYLYKIKKRVSK